MKRATRNGIVGVAILVAVSSAQAWSGLVTAMHARAAVLAAAQEEDPPPEVIQHGLTMLAEGEEFSNYDLWAIAVTIDSPEYTVVAGTEGWIFQGGDMIKIGVGLGEYCEIGEPVEAGVYWNQSEFTVYLSNSEDSSASIEVVANGLLCIGLPTDMLKASTGIGDAPPHVVCRDTYSACCKPNANPPTYRCRRDTDDFSDCEGGGQGAVSCGLDGFVQCRNGFYACCDTNVTPPTYRCLPDDVPDDGCEGGGLGAESCNVPL